MIVSGAIHTGFFKWLPGLFVLGLAFEGTLGCTSASARQKLDAKISQETQISDRRDLELETLRLLDDSKVPDETQRQQLTRLRKETLARSGDLRQTSIKLQSLLTKIFFSPDYDPKEIDLLKNKLAINEDSRLTVYLSAVRQANTIFGRWPSKGARLEDEFKPQPQFPPR